MNRKLPAVVLLLTSFALFYTILRIYHPSATFISQFVCHDLYKEFYQIYDYASSEVRRGNFPLWNPWQSCGLPFHATHQCGLFYPLNAIYLVLPTHQAMAAAFLIHLVLAGTFTYVCARSFGISLYGSLLSALTFMFAGHITYHIGEPGNFYCATWTPLMLYLIKRVCGTPTVGNMLLVALFSSLQFMTGFEQHYMYTLYLMLGYVVFDAINEMQKEGGPARLVRPAGLLAAAGILSAGLVAVQLVPTLEMVLFSARPAEPLSAAQIVGLRKLLAIGTGFEMTTANFFLSLLDPSPGMFAYNYVGLLPLLLLPAALIGKTRRPLAIFLFTMILFCSMVAMVDWGGWSWMLHIPTVAIFRVVYRIMFIAALCFGLLAGIGWDSFWRNRSDIPRRAGSLYASWLFLVCLPLAWALVWRTRADTQRSTFALIAFALALAALLLSRTKRTVRVCQAALLLTLFADLASGAFKPLAFPARNPEIFGLHDGAWDFLRQRQGQQYRSYFKHSQFDSNHMAMAEKHGQLKRVRAITDYEPLASRRLADYASFMQQRELPEQSIFYGQIYDLHPERARLRLLNLMCTRFFLIYRPFLLDEVLAYGQKEWWSSPPDSFSLVYQEPNVRIYENPHALPRAFIAPAFRVIADEKQLLSELDSASFDPAAEVLLSEQPMPADSFAKGDGGSATGAREIQFLRDEPEHLELKVRSPSPGFLVLLDTDYPGWKAAVNGASARIYRADYLFRAIPVGAGESTIELQYAPASFQWGLVISLASLAVWVFIGLLYGGWRRRKKRTESSGRGLEIQAGVISHVDSRD